MNPPLHFKYWGKASPAGSSGARCHLLVYHCLDVAAVAVGYLRRHVKLLAHLRQRLGVVGEERFLRWLAFWLALHDLGKFCAAFQGQRHDLLVELRGDCQARALPYTVRHDTLGMLVWQDLLRKQAAQESWFGDKSGALLRGFDCWARAVTGHHGQPPEAAGDHWSRHAERGNDGEAILGFVGELRRLFLVEGEASEQLVLDERAFCKASIEVSWWIAGITVLADWLGSNSDYFSYRENEISLTDYWARTNAQAANALTASGVVPPGVRTGRTFANLFPEIATPSPLQVWASSAIVERAAQIHILEDVAGSGKTEAAITLVNRLMAAGCVDGFFIGLPTMATANAMYRRLAPISGNLFDGSASVVLAHGRRRLVGAFAASIAPPAVADSDRGEYDETATARCTAWLADHNKAALLAPAGVGTIDQALLAVLHSKHQCLRLLGLFGKVLVVDEVHACDAYMQGVLEKLLEFHARAGGSVILLSATLPACMKQALLDAFARGCGCPAPLRAGGEQADFPLVTGWSPLRADAAPEALGATRRQLKRTLHVRYCADRADIVGEIEAALQAGKCVCWMRNTVADALAAHALFAGRIPRERLTLFHARFALHDRLSIEERVLHDFGKGSTPEARHASLVIATQVVEQSLDADWDLVVSDLAPIDRLLQRAGRLLRHARDASGRRLADPDEPEQRGEPCLWVFGPAWTCEPEASWYSAVFPGGAKVYPHHGQLWLTARAAQSGRWSIPDDARRLIEEVFGEAPVLPGALQVNADQAQGQVYANAATAQQNTVKLSVGYARGGIDWWSEAAAPSRLGEPSVTVVLARWAGDQLDLWAGGEHAYEYSSVRLAERLISRRAEPTGPARRAAFDRLLAGLPDGGRWSIVLALEETAVGWVGDAWRKRPGEPRTRGKPGGATGAEATGDVLIRWQYSAEFGLREMSAPGDEAPGATPQERGTKQASHDTAKPDTVHPRAARGTPGILPQDENGRCSPGKENR